MQAIILAAGMGKRLGEYTQDNTKCMLEVNGIRLIDRALEHLHKLNVSRVVLVVGYKRQNVKDYVGSDFKGTPVVYVDNAIYDRTNNIYSLYQAKDFLLEEDTLLLESDLIYNFDVLEKLYCDTYPNIALVDKYESWMDGTVVTIDECGRITNFIDKSLFKYDEIKSYYKTVNIYKFSKDFSSRYYVPFLTAYCTALGQNEYYEQVLRIILDLRTAPLKALPLNGETWYEIDDVQDLDIAKGMFAPSDEEHYKAISSRYGGYWRYPQMLDFCYLVNPYFPPQRMLDEIKASFETLLCEYPSGMRVNSLLASKNFGVRQEYILMGNGAAELIKSFMERHCHRLGNVIPTFEEYPNRILKENVVSYRSDRADFHYSAEELVNFFNDKDIDTLLIINPDNPSGNFLTMDELKHLLTWTQKKGIRLVVDESFVDFADAMDEKTLLCNDLLAENPNLVVIKSISKSYGVPGLRLGVLATGNTQLVAELVNDVAIWNINSFGEFFMQIYEKYHRDYLQACEDFRRERNRFEKALREIPYLQVYDSQANYFLCKVKEPYTSHQLTLLLLRHNIFIKDCSTKLGFENANYIRLAIRNLHDNDFLIKTLKGL